MIWLVLLGAISLSLAVYFTITYVGHEKVAVSNSADHVFYKHVIEINLKNPDGTSRQDIISHCHKGEELALVPQPDNPRHPDAVKVCCKSGRQIGYLPTDDGRMAHDLATGWSFRTTVDEIYPFEENPQKHGLRLRLEVLTRGQTNAEKRRIN